MAQQQAHLQELDTEAKSRLEAVSTRVQDLDRHTEANHTALREEHRAQAEETQEEIRRLKKATTDLQDDTVQMREVDIQQHTEAIHGLERARESHEASLKDHGAQLGEHLSRLNHLNTESFNLQATSQKELSRLADECRNHRLCVDGDLSSLTENFDDRFDDTTVGSIPLHPRTPSLALVASPRAFCRFADTLIHSDDAKIFPTLLSRVICDP